MRRSVPSWAKGGVWRDDGGWLFLQGGDQRGRVGFRDTEPLGQGRQRAGRGITEAAQSGQEHGQEDVNPSVSFTLDHTEQASLDHLQRIGLYIGQNKQ